jgi:uncharacterized protein (DUF433 family)
MSKVVSLRLKDDQVERLARVARSLDRTVSETAALMVEEALRQAEFAFIEFRPSPAGRQAYLKGSRITVWQIVMYARDVGRNADRIAELLGIPPNRVSAALAYAAAYPAEIEAALADLDRSEDELRRLIPNLNIVRVNEASAG